MLFDSLQFFLFFIVLTSLYFIVPYRQRWLLLLAGSCYFYMAFVPVYILVLGFTIAVDYCAGIYIENATGKRRKRLLLLSLVANIGVLAFFKYYNFLNQNLALLLHGIGWHNPLPYLSVLLPIGLSFHTFQAMSYTIEVYRGRQKAERHFGIYSLYVMFYPQLVAGPIERPQNLLHQFREKHDFDYNRVTSGLRLMAWGLLKKIVIADRLAIAVDTVYNNPHGHSGLHFIIATLFFSYQIYCDFSGYTDMAIGAARVMGFKLMENFNRPYQAEGIHGFWKRWHISLSSWFRDYLYIPLGGNRVAVPRWYLNLFIVFLISGLWHGANWTFVIWGALHGLYLVIALMTRPFREKTAQWLHLGDNRLLRVAATFTLVSFAWIFFRAANIHTAFYIVTHLFTGLPDIMHQGLHFQPRLSELGLSQADLYLSAMLIVFLELVQYIQSKADMARVFIQKPVYVRWIVYGCYILFLLWFGMFDNRQFIYFQF